MGRKPFLIFDQQINLEALLRRHNLTRHIFWELIEILQQLELVLRFSHDYDFSLLSIQTRLLVQMPSSMGFTPR